MAKIDLGGKRQCQNCGTKFFDMNKDPILCPKCGTVFQASPVSARSTRAAAAAAEDDEAELDTGAELVPLEEADGDDEKTPAATSDDADDIEDDAGGDDDTFLEEEEDGNDDVSDLIDGDIESDEER